LGAQGRGVVIDVTLTVCAVTQRTIFLVVGSGSSRFPGFQCIGLGMDASACAEQYPEQS
jgi:hypothetical protein